GSRPGTREGRAKRATRGAGGGARGPARRLTVRCAPVHRIYSKDAMTYIIAEPCIDIKDLSCVDVCPVDCIHQAERILVIDPEECIDCFAPSEQMITSRGVRSFEELENQGCRVLTDSGFKPAIVKRFRR